MNKNLVFFLLALAAFFVVIAVPLPTAGSPDHGTLLVLPYEGKAALAVLVMSVILWMTEAIPFPVTGMLAIVMLTVTRAGEFSTLVREGFGHEIIMFIIGVSIFSAALNQSGLLKRVITVLL
ncbi:anion permease, partial [Candidatus Omnitrophota bacterium]